MEPVLLAAKVSKTEVKDLKPEAKKRVPLTTIANALPAKIKWEMRPFESFWKLLL